VDEIVKSEREGVGFLPAPFYSILSSGTKLDGSFRYSAMPSSIIAISSAVKSVSMEVIEDENA